MKTAIPLRRAYIKFARKHYGFKATRKGYHYDYDTGTTTHPIVSASIHTLPKACHIVRIGPDAIAVTDGGNGYTPFSISELQLMLREAKRLPIATEFRVDVTP